MLGEDIQGPDTREVSFTEGDQDGEINCVMVEIVDDSDFENSIETFPVIIEASFVTLQNFFFGSAIYTIIVINDTGGKVALPYPHICFQLFCAM